MSTLFSVLRRRPARFAALSATVAGVMLFALPSAANASASGTVNTAGTALTVRAAPGTGFDAWDTVADGSKVTILCQTEGSQVSGTYGTSTIWDMLARGGFVSDAYVYTGGDGYVTGKCDYVGAPPRANPRGINAAISWAFSHLGSSAYENLCLKFTGLSYGWSYTNWATAEVGGDYMVNHGYMHTSGIPPRGALVWYHNSSGTGHVVISLGEGKIIGTSVGGQVGVDDYLYHSSYRGWSQPYYPLAG
ncbi:hypothetical protein [Hamadaea tsunoensis]|uniref:hypothetical protein n=1 Tax=Hamadaea tsunoensis TaxID=53368 RepID=UPI000406B16B|nr:hypothetical protein [Hamadaea tsunoensis]